MLNLLGILCCLGVIAFVSVHASLEHRNDVRGHRLNVDAIYRARPVSQFYDQEAGDAR